MHARHTTCNTNYGNDTSSQGSSASAAAASTAAASNIPAPPAPAKGIGKVQSVCLFQVCLSPSLIAARSLRIIALQQAKETCTARAIRNTASPLLYRAPRCSRLHRQHPASCQRLQFPSLPPEPFHQSSAPMVARHPSQLQDDLVGSPDRMYSIGTLSAVSASNAICMTLTSVGKHLQPCIVSHSLHPGNLAIVAMHGR